ncbi:3-isopropylmalate dehydratase small subunit [Ferrimicrobium acidiphilum]|uniref:3-isopropylmalate dehydratase small subunit n=1 Tax=Ferrimicrobium acidiphilum DSM 19497 TaxID=1121877 RepID=A0A0D8FW18_9ACTN|nr:3-isopropylmalate dehydratase small subunit [Ferrimicrobium acidiphilum]KJE77493.1 3-isopropylmalate dehydratase small subunit [Ferrimicrobium acidiphilum DSM 19497]
MEPITELRGHALPLAISDVDTDQIIPSDWLKRVERTGFGEGLFSEWRQDPNFVLNSRQFAGSTILIARENFGVGSSREHAVWSLMDYGFRVVISPRFGDIFRNNSLKVGLLPVQLSADEVSQLLDLVTEHPATEILVDLESQRVSVPSRSIEYRFAIDPTAKARLLAGLDEIGISLTKESKIIEFERRRPVWAPRVLAR